MILHLPVSSEILLPGIGKTGRLALSLAIANIAALWAGENGDASSLLVVLPEKAQ